MLFVPDIFTLKCMNGGYQLKTGQFEVKPFVVSPSSVLRRALSNHERLNRSPFDRLRTNG